MEGLRAFQLYGDESDKKESRQQYLVYFIKEAVARLDECVRLYAGDPLPRYYLGVALTTRNQHDYVEQLFRLRDSFFEFGRYHGLRDKLAPKPELDAAEQASQEAKNLDKEPWPLLHDAVLHFQWLQRRLEKEPSAAGEVATNALLRAAVYNRAEVYARLGRCDQERDDIQTALDILGKMPEPVSLRQYWWQWRMTRPRIRKLKQWKPEKLNRWENVALDLQRQTLQRSLEARHAIKKLASFDRSRPQSEEQQLHKRKLAGALHSLEDLRNELEPMRIQTRKAKTEESDLPPSFETDVVADYWTKLGYLTYERALVSVARTDTSCAQLLEEADDHLRKALALKPNWNPAQIYLALIARVNAGIANVMGDTAAEKRYKKRAGQPLASLLGSAVAVEEPPAKWQLHVEGNLRATPQPDPSG